ncbi:MAG: holo-ACP synthase [Candidatus Fermentibacteraceae bacterium]|nr:holo-ACP synthase [Candidatus Fermentibacteraceae bacterium]
MKTGTDTVEVSRFIRSVTRNQGRLRDRLFTPEELVCNPGDRDLAVMFSAKESVAKALGTGFGPSLSWHDIQIFVSGNKLKAQLSGSALALAGNSEIHLSAAWGDYTSFTFALLTERE